MRKCLKAVIVLTLALFLSGFQDIDSGEFNGDGVPDLAIVNGLIIAVYLGNGDGTFAQSYSLFAPVEGPTSVALADLNGDGNLDMAVADNGPVIPVPVPFFGDVVVFIGTGDGRFSNRATSYEMGFLPTDVATADLDGDGWLDLVATNGAPGLFARLNQGDGNFSEASTFRLGRAPLSLVAGDFDEDGRIDLAVARASADAVTIIRGGGDGTFEQGDDLMVGDGPVAIEAADFNDDSHLDLITVNRQSDDISILLGRGDGGFASANDFAVDRGPISMTLGDFNEDGRLDAGVFNRIGNSVSLLFGRGDGSFDPAQTFSLSPGRDSITSADYNGDGHLDLALGGGNEPVVFLGDGGGNFTRLTP